MDAGNNDFASLEKRLSELEQRLARLEASSGSAAIQSRPADEEDIPLFRPIATEQDESGGLESRIGRFGLAWLGMIVMLFGIVFFTEYLVSKGAPLLSTIIGYSCVTAVYFISVYLRKSNPDLYLRFGVSGLMLAFYITLRLHFFSEKPLIQSGTIGLLLLLLVTGYSVFLAIKREIRPYGTLSVLFLITAAIVSDSTHVMLSLMVLTSATAVYYFHRFRWNSILVLAVLLSYVVFFMWMISNPLMKHPMQLLQDNQGGYVYLFLTGACFSLLPLLRKRDGSEDEYIVSIVITHGILFTILLAFITISYFKTGYVGMYTAVTIVCLAYSVLLKRKTEWNFASAFFALYGFMAMSTAIHGLVGFPGAYLFLSLQSLIVVSMALWLRNRLMIVMNSLLFIFILFVYMISSKAVNGVNFSFALVALVSARIINWKKERLEIRTELMRNLYLIAGFIMVLYALFHAVPGRFVALSWTVAALAYFGLSFLLKNVKYRYMALGTMISAAIYLFVVDLARIEVIYRVLALLFMAAVSIGISIYYTNRLKREKGENAEL